MAILMLVMVVAIVHTGCKKDKDEIATCNDGIQNGNESGIDCGGSCDPCEVEIIPTCDDGIQNGDETGIDCGGDCDPCEAEPTCDDGIQNGDETGVDCGGSCPPCEVLPTCNDGIQNGDETGVDCGGSCPECPFECGTSTIVDIDGNVYNTVAIGSQCWIDRNLSVMTLTNGTPIASISDVDAWDTYLPARCYYGNDAGNDAEFGQLYNWHAVATGNLCPNGWHIPSADDWEALDSYLGGSTSGAQLKPGGGTGFDALFGGHRWPVGQFFDVDSRGYFWSATAASSTDAKRYKISSNALLTLQSVYKEFGNSCRCMMD